MRGIDMTGLLPDSVVQDIAFFIDQILNVSKESISEEAASRKAVERFGKTYGTVPTFDIEQLALDGLDEYRKWHRES